MGRLKKFKLDVHLKIFFIMYALCLGSFINLDNSKMISPLDILITVVVLILLLSKLVMDNVQASFHQFTQLAMVFGVCIIFFNTAYRHAQILGRPTNITLILIVLFSLVGLALQMPYYLKALRVSIPALIQSGKIDQERRIWDIEKKTNYETSTVEKGLEKWMRRISFLTYLAPGTGMILSRNLGFDGHVIFGIGFSLYMFFFLIIGQSLPLAEFWLIKYLKKTRNLDLFVE